MMFWIYMLVCSLLIPLIILGVGALLAKHPPKQINWAYGYRTRRSTKTKRPGFLLRSMREGYGCA